VNRVEQVENKISETEDKVEELDQTMKDHERFLRKSKWKHSIYLGHHEKTKSINHGCRRDKN
jgi:hypothetical protein